MKKMFYSEVLDKYFEDERECHKAELQYQLDKRAEEKAAAEAEAKKKEETALVSKEKKELSDAIEAAKQAVVDTENEYGIACDKYREAVEAAKKTYTEAITTAKKEILFPAKDKVRAAQEAKYNAVKAFNDKFGTYTIKYTGDQAYQEMVRTVNEMNKFFNNFWF